MEKSEFEQKYSNLIETVTLHLHGFIHIGQESWVLFSCPTISCGDRIWSDILALSEDSVQQAFVRAIFLGTTIPTLTFQRMLYYSVTLLYNCMMLILSWLKNEHLKNYSHLQTKLIQYIEKDRY